MEFNLEFIGWIVLTYIIILLLDITLFFKIWGMTNNVNKIKDLLQEWLDLEHPVVESEEKTKDNSL